MWQRFCDDLRSEGAHSRAHWGEAVQVHLRRLSQGFQNQWRSRKASSNTHGFVYVCVEVITVILLMYLLNYRRKAFPVSV